MTSSSSNKGLTGLGNAAIRFCAFGLFASSAAKFLHPAGVIAYMGFLGYDGALLFLIAGMEAVIATLLLLARTRPGGLLLVSAYFGGAIAAHLANHPYTGSRPFIEFNIGHHYLGALPAALLLLSAWLGVSLRHPEWVRSFRERLS